MVVVLAQPTKTALVSELVLITNRTPAAALKVSVRARDLETLSEESIG